jgi:hypothetical protein
VIKRLVIAGLVVATAAFLVAPLALAARGGDACQVGDAGMTNSLDAEQESNLGAILSVADRSGVGQTGRVIGVMTALTESSLRNLDYGDTAGPDSRGLFQQRDGWGPLTVRMDPVGAAGLFYAALVNVPRWQLMKPWEAAQSVQRSAFSNGENYRRNLDLAEGLARTAPSGPSGCDPSSWSPGGLAELPGAKEAVARALAWSATMATTNSVRVLPRTSGDGRSPGTYRRRSSGREWLLRATRTSAIVTHLSERSSSGLRADPTATLPSSSATGASFRTTSVIDRLVKAASTSSRSRPSSLSGVPPISGGPLLSMQPSRVDPTR